MYLITGGLGKIGSLIRTNIDALANAVVFDSSNDVEQNVADINVLHTAITESGVKVVIHLAETGRKEFDEGKRDIQAYKDNTRSFTNLVRLSKHLGFKLIYITDMNVNVGGFDRAKKRNEVRTFNQVEKGYILPLPIVLPEHYNFKTATGHELINVLDKHLKCVDDVYILNRRVDELVYLATENMVVDAFGDLVENLDSVESGYITNDRYIAITAGRLVELLKLNFPNISVVLNDQNSNIEEVDTLVNIERNVEILENYFRKLPFSKQYVNDDPTSV